MKEFLFLYRTDYAYRQNPTQEQSEAMMKKWMDWLNSIGAENKLVTQGHRLHDGGKTVKPGNVITNGPYSDIKEVIGGYSIIKTDSYDDAVELAKGCPILATGGLVEVREIDKM